ncbi:RNA polymerase II-associated protein 1 isoform X1 [Oryzias latipes]|uniref:RNA polymerase II-associated protein 1 isoform X1 n=1 Tax=Oryzias latipes TaxID=8090 RepID=UPI0009DA1404|nr:RNA polymerase II-associated protein 1 isoform X1 [Oryzias latipes]XP_023807019.1 RNA polymerase II-associated protein 1 isoform X1 [Oryzias latipes]
MLRRPQPSDCEADLLREQESFLASGAPSAASVLRRPDKRRGQGGEAEGDGSQENGGTQKDVVTIEDLPDELPSLTPAPPKKSRFKASRVTFEEDDAEDRLDAHDTHISAVLSRIVERDTSSVPISLPAFTGMAFPKVMHRSETSSQVKAPPSSVRGKKSIFARQIAAQKLNEAKTPQDDSSGSSQTSGLKEQNLPAETGMDIALSDASVASQPRLVSGQGLGVLDGSTETLRIHMENQAKLRVMSQSEILEEQKKLLSQLDPRLVEFVRSHKAQSVQSEETNKKEDALEKAGGPPSSGPVFYCERSMEEEEPQPPSAIITEVELPVKPQKEWVHMDKLEPEKLEWMKDLPPPRKKGTEKAMQARFDFAGTLMPPTEDLPTHLGLHHHGEEPERAGYSLQELFLLSRSQLIQQRSLALNTLANILSKARAGEYASALRGTVTSTLLDAGVLFLLRFALDDGVEGVMSAAVHALKALLVSSEDEECMDSTFSWYLGLASFPLLPSSQDDEEEDYEGVDGCMKQTAKEKEEQKSDFDVTQQDVVKGLLKMKLLPRLRYILEVMRPSPRVAQDVLQILTRVARHSLSSATEVLNCPRLMETVTSEFLPTSWSASSSPNPQSIYGVPVPSAMKLLRVLATSGRHNCARLLNSLGVKERLSRLLGAEPSELLLEPSEALRVTTEAYRFWAVAAGYGQACQLYIDLYSALLKSLQSGHRLAPPSHALQPLQLQRLSALLSLLTQVTHAAGCHQELQAGVLSAQGEECPPPPPVSWGHVSGLQASLLGHLKGLVKSLDSPVQADSSLTLIPAYLVYLQAYYQQLSRQTFFKPVETLQELELLTSDVLLPLLCHSVVQGLMNNLRSSSLVCNVQSHHPGPETTSNLPGLACAGWKERSGLVVPSSPFALVIGLGSLLETITGIHRGLSSKFSSFLLSEPVIGYLQACSKSTPTLSVSRAWLLRHEHLLLYLLLRMAHRLVPVDVEVAKQASLYHQVALVLLPWLLPGSEYLAHELLSTVIFNKDFISEGHSGGPEAVELGELKLHDDVRLHPSPSLQTVGALLREACVQLPSIRGCFLTHLAYLEPSVIASRKALLGRNPWISSHLLPEVTGPTLPSDWPFLPLIKLYEQTGVSGGGGLAVEELPAGALQAAVHCLQWLLLLEVWREESLKVVPPVAKLARLSCVFLCSSDLFLERPVQKLTWGLFRLLTRASRLDSLDLDVPPPGLASFQDLYSALLAQYESVSFGDQLFGCWVLLPLQRRYSASLRLAVFGEHVGMLRSLGVTLEQLSIPIEQFTSPPEDSLPLLRLYFRSLVTGSLKLSWCPVLYVVALSHVNSFIFSQDAAAQEVEAARHSILRKIYYLTDEVLRNHLLLFRLPQPHTQLGFDTYAELPPIRAKRLESVCKAGTAKETA